MGIIAVIYELCTSVIPKENMRNIIYFTIILIGLTACSNRRTFSLENGQITNDSIVRIEFYLSSTFLSRDSIKVPIHVINDKKSIQELIGEINAANNPEPMKGAGWDKIYIVKNDTIIKLNTNRKVIGTRGDGLFYHFDDQELLQKHFNK